MLVEITDKIYKLVVPYPQQNGDVNCYFIKGETGFTLLDTGIYSEQAVQLWESILSDGIVIEKIVLTHTHPDHIGMAAWLNKRLGIPVSMSKIGFEIMQKTHDQWIEYERGEVQNEPYSFYLKHGAPIVSFKKMLKELNVLHFEPDHLFEDGQEVRLGSEGYKAVWTPGHAADHFCFYNPKCLFVGDHVLGSISPVITFTTEDENPLQDYFRSLDLIVNYDTELVLPGHGGAIANLGQRVSELRNGHLFRMRQIVEVLRENELTAADVSGRLYNDKSGKLRMMEIQSTLARLIYLKSQGQITSRVQDGLILFSLTS